METKVYSERANESYTAVKRQGTRHFKSDFSKHNDKVNSGRILMVFRSIVAQLAKLNKKFMYGAVREGSRACDLEEAIEWLVSAGTLNHVHNVSKIEHPLSAFDKLDQFKLFVFDTGLLNIWQASRCERSEARQGYRSGHYDRYLTT